MSGYFPDFQIKCDILRIITKEYGEYILDFLYDTFSVNKRKKVKIQDAIILLKSSFERHGDTSFTTLFREDPEESDIIDQDFQTKVSRKLKKIVIELSKARLLSTDDNIYLSPTPEMSSLFIYLQSSETRDILLTNIGIAGIVNNLNTIPSLLSSDREAMINYYDEQIKSLQQKILNLKDTNIQKVSADGMSMLMKQMQEEVNKYRISITTLRDIIKSRHPLRDITHLHGTMQEVLHRHFDFFKRLKTEDGAGNVYAQLQDNSQNIIEDLNKSAETARLWIGDNYPDLMPDFYSLRDNIDELIEAFVKLNQLEQYINSHYVYKFLEYHFNNRQEHRNVNKLMELLKTRRESGLTTDLVFVNPLFDVLKTVWKEEQPRKEKDIRLTILPEKRSSSPVASQRDSYGDVLHEVITHTVRLSDIYETYRKHQGMDVLDFESAIGILLYIQNMYDYRPLVQPFTMLCRTESETSIMTMTNYTVSIKEERI